MAGLISPIELSVIVPTYNEVENVEILSKKNFKILLDQQWEIIFVDDNSPDETYKKIAVLSEQDFRIRMIHRTGRNGLSSACLEGVLSSNANYIAIMDADLQYNVTLLKGMLQEIRKDCVYLERNPSCQKHSGVKETTNIA